MPDTTPTFPTDILSNGTKLAIKLSSDTGTDYTEILDVADSIGIPDQSYNSVEANLVNAANGIKPRFLGSRNGGDLTFKIDVINTTNAGLVKLLTAYLGKLECSFKVTYPSGAYKEIPNCKVQKCNPAEHSLDALIAYDVSCIVNGLISDHTSA